VAKQEKAEAQVGQCPLPSPRQEALAADVSVWHHHLERARVRGPVADCGQAVPRARLAGVLADQAAVAAH
jgi:hypothetical protein